MRLLKRLSNEEICLVGPFAQDHVPPYAILSHRWESDPKQEVDYNDMVSARGRDRAGYKKIQFCAEQAAQDNLEHFWVDTCCINKSLDGEHQQAIRSMFRWYQRAEKCYAYLSDVNTKKRRIWQQSTGSDQEQTESDWKTSFQASDWFKRGWTLQELLAPRSVEFFSKDGKRVGDKRSLEELIHKITGIQSLALKGQLLATFSETERFLWMERRQTSLPEDKVYALLGIFDIDIPIYYGEGWLHAYDRLTEALKTRNGIIRELRITNPRSDKLRIEADKGGLLPSICKWVFDSAEFQQWHSCNEQHLLWIRGDPGRGKTMLLCGIINELENSMPQQSIVSYFFCQATDSRINNAIAILRGLFYLLAQQQPSLLSHIEKEYHHAGSGLFEDVNSWSTLKESFLGILQDPKLMNAILVVDGLDECKFGLPKLLQFITESSQSSAKVKWIVSSRDWPSIEQMFQNVQQMLNLQLELNAESVSQAVQSYIRDRVDQLAKDKKYSESLKRAVLQHFQLNAEGTFLWVALVYDSLCKVRKQHVKSKLNDFPAGLNGLYGQMLSQIQADTDSCDRCSRILAVVSLVFRPLTLNELSLIVDSTAEASLDLEDTEEDVRLCGSMLGIRDQTVYFVHHSAKDWIFTQANQTVFPLGQAQEHRQLAQWCIDQLNICGDLKNDIFNVKRPGVRRIEYSTEAMAAKLQPGVAYACLYWAVHFTASDDDLLDHGYVHQFLQQHFLHWVEALSWLGQLSSAIGFVTTLQSRAKASQISAFLKDAHRFLLRNSHVIDLAPLQTYYSALIFAPKETLIRKTFEPDQLEIHIRIVVPSRWDAETLKLEGHTGNVTAVAFSPDSLTVASGSDDGTVQLWNAHTGAKMLRLEGHRHVSAVAFFPHSLIASGFGSKTDQLWDPDASAEMHRAVERDRSPVTAVAFSPDSLTVVSGSNDHTVRLWDTSTGAEMQKLAGHSSRVTAVAFSPDGSAIASASNDGTVRIWDRYTGAETHRLVEEHSCLVTAVAFSPDSLTVASVSTSKTVRLWEAHTGAQTQKLEGHSSCFTAVAFSPDSSTVVTGREDGIIQLWDVHTGAEMQRLEGHTSRVTAVAFVPGSSTVASESCDGTVRLWDAQTGAATQKFEGHSRQASAVAFSPDCSTVVSGSADAVVRLWDAHAGDETLRLVERHNGWITAVTFSADGSTVASTSHDGTVQIWDAHTGAEKQRLKGHSKWTSAVAFSPDSSAVVSGSRDETVRIWDVHTGIEIQRLKGHSSEVTDVAFSPDSSTVASTSYDGVCLWDVLTGAETQRLVDRSGRWITAVAFSPDGSTVVFGSGNGMVQLWDVHTGAKTLEFKGHRSQVIALAFSSDGLTVASGTDDKTVLLWDAHTGAEKQRLEWHGPHDINKEILNDLLMRQEGDVASVALGVRDQWLTMDGNDVLWLPHEYRGTCSAVHGQRLAIGQAAGDVFFFEHCR